MYTSQLFMKLLKKERERESESGVFRPFPKARSQGDLV